MRLSTQLISLVAALGLGACDVGSITGPGGGPGGTGGPGGNDSPDAAPAPGVPDAAPPDFLITVMSPTTTTDLGTDVHYQVSVAGLHGMSGSIALIATGLPASWTATITPPSVTLDATGMATADLDVTIPTDAKDLSGAAFGVSASGGAITHAAMAPALTVTNEVVVTIPDGTGTAVHPFPARIDINLGTKLRIVDADTKTAHRIHSDAVGEGFDHQPNDMNAGQEYDVTPTVGGGTQYRWYCHDHGQGDGVVNTVVH